MAVIRDRVTRRKPVQKINIPKHASCLQQGTKVILKNFEINNGQILHNAGVKSTKRLTQKEPQL
jgi:hypothetical protein